MLATAYRHFLKVLLHLAIVKYRQIYAAALNYNNLIATVLATIALHVPGRIVYTGLQSAAVRNYLIAVAANAIYWSVAICIVMILTKQL